MAALRNAGGYTVVVPDEEAGTYLNEGWQHVGAAPEAPADRPKRPRTPRARKPRLVKPEPEPIE
jgi:hypothetical protein